MSRTPLFGALKKALALASRDNSVVGPRTSALTRRTLLRSSAAAAGAAALSPLLDWSAYARGQPKGPIGIVGGGVAGLTAAYRLHQAGKTPIVFEASNRWGGRMFTRYDFYKGMFCELGAEFVDSNHGDLQKLLDEFGLKRQRLEDEGEVLYFFKGAFHTNEELLDKQTQKGAFVPIAKQIHDDHKGLKDERGNWTAHARDLDGISLKDYLESFRHKIKDDWVIDLLDVAYVGENGLETEDQSSLHLVDVIGTALNKDFEIFGDSDEAWRIEGGSSTLIDKGLVPALKDKIEMNRGWALTGIEDQNGHIALSFDTPGGAKQQRTFDAVILALPFTCLRNVEGLDSLGLSSGKLDCIRHLGMGHGAKIIVGTTSRVWRTPPASGLPVPSDGSALSDLAFHEFWQTSDTQPGEAGILTNFLGGNAGLNDEKSAHDAFLAGLAKMSPKIAESLDPDPKAVTSMFWSNYRYTLGSYSCAKVGQYTTMFDEAGEPALNGRLQFAGEHTSGAKYQGYMNGGVRSGNRAAKKLIEVMALHE
jgi:monoamine oxidase